MGTNTNLSVLYESVNTHNNLLYLLDYENSTDLSLQTNRTFPGGGGTRGAAGHRPRMPPRRRMSATVEAVSTLSYYSCPAILAIGIISNIVAYLIFTRTRLRKVPSVPYLAAIGVVDTGALITEFISVELTKHGVQFIVMSGVCQYVTYMNYVFIFLCMWYPVALCLEKFIAVYFPLRKAALCTPFKAKVVVIAMAVLTCVCYYYIIYMTGPRSHPIFGMFCGSWSEFQDAFTLLMKLDFVFVNIVPYILLIVLVILILARSCEYYRINSSSSVEVNARPSTSRNGSSSTSPLLITNVVYYLVVVMLLLKLPMSIVRFNGFVNRRTMSKLTIELQPVFLYMNRLDWAVKLYVYLIFSPPFRKSFVSFFRSTCVKLFDRGSSETEDGRIVPPRILLTDRIEAGQETRACLMTSADV